MALATDTKYRAFIALADKAAGDDLVAHIDAFGAAVVSAIVATNVSTTVDFGALKIGDKVVQIPATAGNAHFLPIVTAGTLPEAAVVGDLYVVLRDF
jgi:hypothetical protein